MVAIRERLVDAAKTESKLFDGVTVTCTQGHGSELKEGQWQSV